jgi:hypothetical protein
MHAITASMLLDSWSGAKQQRRQQSCQKTAAGIARNTHQYESQQL